MADDINAEAGLGGHKGIRTDELVKGSDEVTKKGGRKGN